MPTSGFARAHPAVRLFCASPGARSLCGDVQGHDHTRLWDAVKAMSAVNSPKEERPPSWGTMCPSGMIDGAKKTAAAEGLDHLTYAVSDLRGGQFGDPENPVDLVIAVFLFNYMDRPPCPASWSVFGLCSSREAGSFLRFPTHCCLGSSLPRSPSYMRPEGGYLSAVDVPFPGRIWRRDGESVEVQAVHKTFTTYFNALALQGSHDAACRGASHHRRSRGARPRILRTSGRLALACGLFTFAHDQSTSPSVLGPHTGPQVADPPCVAFSAAGKGPGRCSIGSSHSLVVKCPD